MMTDYPLDVVKQVLYEKSGDRRLPFPTGGSALVRLRMKGLYHNHGGTL